MYRYIKYALLALCISLIVSTSSASLTGFAYSKTCNITGNDGWAGDLSNYPVKIVVHNTTGSDSGSDVYIDTKVTYSDMRDIRFASTADSEYDYWIEHTADTSTSRTFWVEVSSIPDDGVITQVVMYYNSTGSSSSESNGVDTFTFFDDFDGGSLDAKWTQRGSGLSISDSIATLSYSGGYSDIYSDNTYGANGDLMFYGSLTKNVMTEAGYQTASDGNTVAFYISDNAGSDRYESMTKSGGGTGTTNLGTSYTGDHKWEVIRESGGNPTRFLIDNSQVSTHSTAVGSGAANIYFLAYVSTSQVTIDWVALRSWADPDVVITSWSTETVYAVTPDASFTSNVTSGYPSFDVLFNDTSTQSPTNWDWYVDEVKISDDQNVTITFDDVIGNTIRSYNISLYASNIGGGDWKNETNYITAYPLNTSFNATPTIGCSPLSVSFFDNTINGTATNWYWDFGDVNTSSLQDPTHSYIGIGLYTVTLNSSNTFSFDTYTVTDLINVTGVPPIAWFVSDVVGGVIPLDVTFTDTSLYTPTSWNWSFGDGSYSDDQNPMHTYSVEGTYTVNLTVTNDCGSDSEIKTNYITTGCPSLISGFSANITEGCPTLPVLFTDSSIGTNILNWSWDFDGDNIADSFDQNPTWEFTTSGAYSINLTITDICGTDSEIKTNYITVYSDTISASFFASDTTVYTGVDVYFTDTSTGYPSVWAWSWGDETYNGTTQNPSHSYSSPGTYTVNLTVLNPCGGIDVESKIGYINVTEAPEVVVTPYPTTGSPTGANINAIIFIILLIVATALFIISEYINNSYYAHIILMGIACLLFAILSNIAISGNLTDEFSVIEDSTLGYYILLMAVISGITVGLYIYELIFYNESDLE